MKSRSLSVELSAPTTVTAIRFVILLGVVSLLADATYEGARSVAGPYLALLGASGTVVGVVAGFGELVGYGLRLLSGYLSDRTRRYWTWTLVGYAINLLAVPLLALAGRWEIAAALLIMERVGKALRTPSRDAMLSYATKQIGRGWGFGLHEAMDQVGAIAGPLLVAAMLATRNNYPAAFAILAIPALLALSTLMAARWLYPRPQDLEPTTPEIRTAGFSRAYWIYFAAVALIAAGYVDFPLIAYHFKKVSSVPGSWIPVLYAVAMGVDALAALLFGRGFDRVGIPILVVAALISALAAPLVFLGGFGWAIVGMTIWGIGMGAQESVLRAAVATMVSQDRRGAAYGIFNTGFGVFWFLGSALMGVLYDFSLPALIAFSVALQLASVPLFFAVGRQLRSEPTSAM
ncbi:MAG: MFS transporter [Anaerolineae bacterium]|nr:MFS transporter [Anaerolineae bacterium]MCX8067289.1 MFS transporter [Anaerolineae bacterium]MDW7991897.1 MFS transporter [Anaerolineae bacterium]